jgi:energy-coupling factor transporter transmembrane protein EcfT
LLKERNFKLRAKAVIMKLSKSIWIFLALLIAIALFLPLPAYAQSCALCYTQAASSGSRMIQALKSGILILIAPPTFMSVGLIVVCYRKRNQTRKQNDPRGDREWPTESLRSSRERDW